MIDSATAAAAASATSGRAAASGQKFDEEYTNFLTLLTTQLQNQDPTSPMDSSEFTNQIVQFTSVEQQIQTNKNLENLSTLMLASMNAGATNYLGQDAVLATSFGKFEGDELKWDYVLPDENINAGLAIFDADGEQVASFVAPADNGFHSFKWDGKDENGNQLEEGTYEFRVLSFNADGDELTVPVQVTMPITAVTTQGFEPVYTVGGEPVTRSQILQIQLPDKTPEPANNTGTNSDTE